MSSDRWIVVRNWERFQHRDALRSGGIPNWMKVYTRLIFDDDYVDLTLTEKGALQVVWLLFLASDGQLSATRVSSRGPLSVSGKLLDSLNHAGFIVFSASKPPRVSASTEGKGKEEPPQPPQGGSDASRSDNGPPGKKLTKRELAKFTGCKQTRGTHGTGYTHRPLGTDKPPPDWPHPAPTQAEVETALAAAATFLAHITDETETDQ